MRTGSEGVGVAPPDVAGPRLITGSPIAVADACVGADHRQGFAPQPTEGASNEITEYLQLRTDIHNRACMNGVSRQNFLQSEFPAIMVVAVKRGGTVMPETDDEIAHEITITLLRVINKIAQGRRTARSYGRARMTLVEAEMCLMISDHPGITGAEMSDNLGVTRSATSQVISKLKSKGFVTESHDVADAKRKQLFVTNLGREAAEIANGYSQRMREELFGASRGELESYRRFVTKLEAFHDRARTEWQAEEE